MTSTTERAPFRHTVKPGINSVIYLRTVPRATCFRRREQDDDPSRYLK